MSPSPRQLAREQRSHGPGPACFYRWLLRVEQTINRRQTLCFLIGGQDNKWLRELMQRSVKPGNKLLVLKTTQETSKSRGLAIRGFCRFNFPLLPVFSKDQSGVCDLRAHSANLNSFNRVSESYCPGFCIKQMLRYQVLEEIHRNGT